MKIAEGFDELSYGRDFIRDYKMVVGGEYGDIYAKVLAQIRG